MDIRKLTPYLLVPTKVIGVAIVVTLFFFALAVIFRGRLETEVPPVDPGMVAEQLALRDVEGRVGEALKNPPRNIREVDYTKGESAPWFPRGESPLLAELVREGKLPPVAERVGPEPLVARGPDGVGRYGGTWTRSMDSDSAFKWLSALQTGVSLVRMSPLADQPEPYLARAFEISEDQRV